MTDYRDVILAPILTEKTLKMMDQDNKYTFRVPKTVNKIEIREAVEHLFGVKVTNVNTLNVKPKKKRVGRFVGKTSAYKKAIVTVEKGQTIPVLGDTDAE